MSVSESETNAIDEDVKFENPQLETESLRLDFRLEYTWKSSLKDSISSWAIPPCTGHITQENRGSKARF